MARLRDKDTGCPWDVEQTFATIAPYTIEEAYEVAEAIARDDLDALKDELGDLLLQVVYHAQMASEDGRFGFADVVDGITRKMIRRHPHVFGDASRDEFLAEDMWRRIKDEEKAEVARRRPPRGWMTCRSRSLLSRVPSSCRSARPMWDSTGRVWTSVHKAEEEIAELKAAIAESEGTQSGTQRVAEEFGDLLFVMANIARHLGVDPEAALRGANAKFMRRFQSIEAALAKDGRKPEDATLEEMDPLWDEAKAAETNPEPIPPLDGGVQGRRGGRAARASRAPRGCARR